MKNADYLTEGHLFRGLITISLPIVASNLLQSVLEVVDLYFVGRLGADAIAGVAMSATIMFVLATFIVGLVTATTAFVSRHYGAREHETVGLIVQHSLYIGLVFSLAISVFGLFFSRDLLILLGADEAVALLGSAYLSVLFLGIFTMVELWVVISSFQACGNSYTPMLLMIGVNIVNIFLTPVLIFGLAGFPAFGVAGSALATIISRGLGFVIGMLLLVRYSSHITFPKTWSLDFTLIRRILAVALPNSVQSGLRSGTFLVMMAFVAPFGTAAISGYGIAGRLELIALMPGFAIATATAVIVGQNIGAKKPERAERGVKLALFLYGTIMIAFSAVYYLSADTLIRFFDPGGTSVMTGVSYFQTVTPFYIIMAVSIIVSFALNGAGDTKKPMYATLVSMVLIQIPLAYVLSVHAGFGIAGIWIAVIIGIIVQAILLTVMYRSGSWKRIHLSSIPGDSAKRR